MHLDRVLSLRRRPLLLGGLSALLLPAACGTPPAGRLREYTVEAAPARIALLGANEAPVNAWAYNGTVPGPVLRARQGDTLRVHLVNRLPQETTLHWHGLRVPHAMDGVPHLTQHPVPPGGRFTYEFPLADAGTYWYHSHHHSSEQLDRGLHGLLIVEEREPPRADREVSWVLDDWRLTRAGQIQDNFGNAHDMSHAGRVGNVVSVNGGMPEPLRLRPGERVRIRILNAANARLFALRFMGLRPQVVALDGHPVAPHEPPGGRVVLGPGMRADLLLDADGRAGERHTVRDTFYAREVYELIDVLIDGAPLRSEPLPAPAAWAANPVAEPDLARARSHAIVFEGGMMGALHSARLDGQPMDMRGLLQRGKAWAINGDVAAGHDMRPALTLARGTSVVLALANRTRWHHPIHLHGHTFRVLRRNGRAEPLTPWHDTVLLGPDETADIAFVADNPGDWMLHCHILEHQEGGMMSVVRVA